MGLREKGAALLVTRILSLFGGSTDANIPNDNVENIPQSKTENIEVYTEEMPEGIIKYNDKENTISVEANNQELIVDLSEFQGEVDWEKIKELNPSLVIVRSHYASGETFYEDERFEENIKACAEYGFNIGTYFIARLTQNEEEVKREANIMLERLQEMNTKYGVRPKLVAIDYEMKLHTSNPEISAKSIRMLCDMLTEAEYTPMIYASVSNYNDLIYAAEKANIDLNDILEWIAYYTSSNSFALTNSTQSIESVITNATEIINNAMGKYALLQIGDNARYTSGVDGKLDISVITSDEMKDVINTEYIPPTNPEIKEEPVIEETPSVVTPTEDIKENNAKETDIEIKEEKDIQKVDNVKTIPRIISDGETVSELCEKFNLSIDEFKSYNPDIEDINNIKAAQTVNIPLENIEAAINMQAENGEITKEEAEHKYLSLKYAALLFGSSIFSACLIPSIVENRKKKQSKYKYNPNWEDKWEEDKYKNSSSGRKSR